ncbi:hypothetical protein [Yellowstone lake phycodnavirus 3]|uniref:hypothetical protein n=1 Tax=Yellowstone lake phycodnavirus 3 TaxID=1586715 RepID=UPI0006EB5D7E|nr:hypothetical protein AR677_gp016 [Yellowstone lake phycodnavirus 3]BAT22515.1 hypothetical protein [Yellowstone lake phycodnavirus 3]
MVSLKNIRGPVRISRARASSAPGRARVSRSRTARPTSAPGRISLNKESILGMTKTQARAALRSTTPMSFYRKGRAGLVLFALLLIVATRPAGALGVNFAGAAGYKPATTNVTPRAKHWSDAFRLKEKSAAAQVAQQSALLATAYTTGSGTATTAVALSQFTSTAYGKYIVAMAIISYIISSILRYGEARMARQTQKEQVALIEKQMAHQTRMMQMIMNSQVRSPRGGRRAPITANRIGQLAITA